MAGWAAAASIAGDALQAGASAYGAYISNKQAAQSVKNQIDFQRESTQKRYEWTMTSMRRAGLNPLLAYQQGGGSGMPGASYTPRNILGDLPDVGASASNAVKVYQASEQNKKLQAETENVKKDTQLKQESVGVAKATQKNIWSDTMLKNAQGVHESRKIGQTSAQTLRTEQETVLTKLNQIIAQERTAMAKAGAAGAKHEEAMMKTAYGKWLKWLDLTGRSINPFTSSARDLGGSYDTRRY